MQKKLLPHSKENKCSETCSLCNCPTFQQNLLLKKLRDKIYKKWFELNEEDNQIVAKNQCQQLSAVIARLLEVIMGSKLMNSSRNCQHKKIISYIRKKCRCSQKQMISTCNQILIELGKYKYQLDLLENQISNFEQRLGKIIQPTNNDSISSSSVKRQNDRIQTYNAQKNGKNKNLMTKESAAPMSVPVKKQDGEPVAENLQEPFEMGMPSRFVLFPFYFNFSS